MAPVLNSLLEKGVSFCSSLKALSTDTSFIKIGVCCQKLLTLEFNFHYRLSSHCVFFEGGLRRCLMCMYSYKSKQASTQDWGGGLAWGVLPKKFLEIRCSEIASRAIFGRKQSRGSYHFHPIFGCPTYIHLASWLQISTRQSRKFGRSVDGMHQYDNWWTLERLT